MTIWIILGSMAWLGLGFLARCWIKGYFVAQFGRMLGKEAFTKEQEIVEGMLILFGLIDLLSVAVWIFLSTPKGCRRKFSL